MRKSTKITAGLGVVAGLAVALSPLATFAAQPTRTDTLTVTVQEACTINGSALNSAGTDLETGETAVAVTNNYAATVDPGEEEEFNLPSGTDEATFLIYCNYNNGYKIVATPTNPSGTDQANTGVTIPAGTAINGNTSYWAAKVTGGGNLTSANGTNWFAITGASQTVASNSAGSATDGDSFTVEYKVGAAHALKAGGYQGQVVYTLVRGA